MNIKLGIITALVAAAFACYDAPNYCQYDVTLDGAVGLDDAHQAIRNGASDAFIQGVLTHQGRTCE